MQKGFYVSGDKILIQGDRLLLVLTPKEVIDTVVNDEELFMRACKRGKSELRAIQNEQRTHKREQQLAEQIRRSEEDLMQEIQEME